MVSDRRGGHSKNARQSGSTWVSGPRRNASGFGLKAISMVPLCPRCVHYVLRQRCHDSLEQAPPWYVVAEVAIQKTHGSPVPHGQAHLQTYLTSVGAL